MDVVDLDHSELVFDLEPELLLVHTMPTGDQLFDPSQDLENPSPQTEIQRVING